MRLLGAALLCLLAPAASAREPFEPLVDAFIAAFVQDSMTAIHPVAIETSTEPWHDVIDALERLDCFTIARHTWSVREQTGDAATIDVELHATAIAIGTPRTETLLPERWLLSAVRRDGGKWVLSGAPTPERLLAKEFVNDPSGEHFRRLASRPGVDPDQLLIRIAQHNPAPGEGHLEIAQWVVDTAKRLGAAPRVIAEGLAAQASAHNNKGLVPRGTEYAAELLQFALSIGDPDLIADAYLRLGLNRWLGGDSAGALPELRESTKWLGRARDPRQALRAHHLIGVINEHDGKPAEALTAAEATLREGLRFGWLPAICNSRFVLGNVHEQLGNLEIAVSYQRDALRCSEERLHHGNTALALVNLSSLLMRTEPAADVKPLLRRAIAIAPGWLHDDAFAQMHNLLGFLLLPSAEAEAELQKGLALAQSSREQRALIDALLGLSRLRLAQKRYDEALAFAERALAAPGGPQGIGRTASGVLEEWPALLERARALRALGRAADAEEAYRAAVRGIETRLEALPVRGEVLTNFLDDKTAPYRELAALLADQDRGREAVAISAAVKARALRDLLEGGRVDLASRMTEEERQAEQRLVAALHDANAAVLQADDADARRARDEAQLALERFQKQLALLRPGLRARATTMDDDPLASPEVVSKALILDYVVTADATHLFVIRNGRVDVHRLAAGRRELAAAVDKLLARIKTRDLRYSAEAKKLYQLLLAPAEEHFEAGTTIHIIPDDVLWNLPFHALRNARGTYLVETAPVHYAPSLSVLRTARPAPDQGPRTVLAVGDPAAARPLPHAALEVAEIAKIHGPSTTVLTGNAALERVVKEEAPRYDILHFAAHAIPDDRRPLYSAVLLTPGDGEDGLLEARELMQLELRANLGILAACSSGTGTIRAAEGTIGLSWAFLVAGCPTTVVTKWEVDSPATRHLMTDFHRHLHTGASPAAALRAAQVKLMKDVRYGHPLDWGAFVVVGVP